MAIRPLAVSPALQAMLAADKARGIDVFAPSATVEQPPASPPAAPLILERPDWHQEAAERDARERAEARERRLRDAAPIDAEALEDTVTGPRPKARRLTATRALLDEIRGTAR